MKCPRCNDCALKPITIKPLNVELIRCTSCNGLWSDKEKLGQVLGEQATSKLEIPAYAMKSVNASCPACEVSLYEFCYPNTEIQVDSCKTCEGVWLDDKEINAINKAEKDNIQLVCPRCQADNNCHKNAIALASCCSCGRLFKNLFDSSGNALAPVDDAKSFHGSTSSESSKGQTQSDKEISPDHITVEYEWGNVQDVEAEYKFCLFALPAMLFIGTLFNNSGLGGQIQRIWLTMPVHEFGHALTAWLTGYNAIPSLWVTQIFSDSRGLFAPMLLCFGILCLIRYALTKNSLLGLILSVGLLVVQFIGTFIVSPNTANMLFTYGGDGMGMILATLLMASFYFGKETSLYKGALRWGFVAIGAAAFVDIYSVWLSSLDDIGNVPYGTTGGRYTDSYKLVEDHGWSFKTLINRYLMLGNVCLVILFVVYFIGLKKAKSILVMRRKQDS
jgi:Zn-finger nucleic acid-binding protein